MNHFHHRMDVLPKAAISNSNLSNGLKKNNPAKPFSQDIHRIMRSELLTPTDKIRKRYLPDGEYPVLALVRACWD